MNKTHNNIMLAVIAFLILGAAAYYITRSAQDTAATYNLRVQQQGNAVNKPAAGTVTTTTVTTGGVGKKIEPEDVSLQVGQSGGVSDLHIEFRDVKSDSRCPKGVQCIQAGWVEADVVFTDGTKEANFLMKSTGEAVVFNGYRVKITEVAPTKEEGEKINPELYRLTFNISSI